MMDTRFPKQIDDAVSVILAHQGSGKIVREVLEMVYRLGHFDGQIASAESAVAKLKEAA